MDFKLDIRRSKEGDLECYIALWKANDTYVEHGRFHLGEDYEKWNFFLKFFMSTIIKYSYLD